jgi:hypothetical protein
MIPFNHRSVKTIYITSNRPWVKAIMNCLSLYVGPSVYFYGVSDCPLVSKNFYRRDLHWLHVSGGIKLYRPALNC